MRRLVQLSALAAIVLATATAALAHGPDGEMTVLVAEATSGPAIVLEVGILYADDGHFAEEAVVEAMLTGPGGESLGPVSLSRISGARYRATVPVPAAGSWEIEIVAENPRAEATATVMVPEPTTTTVPETTTTTTTTPLPEPAPDTTLPGPEPEDAQAPGRAPLAPVAVVSAALVIGVIAFTLRRRQR